MNQRDDTAEKGANAAEIDDRDWQLFPPLRPKPDQARTEPVDGGSTPTVE
jgi:hypothetical protein